MSGQTSVRTTSYYSVGKEVWALSTIVCLPSSKKKIITIPFPLANFPFHIMYIWTVYLLTFQFTLLFIWFLHIIDFGWRRLWDLSLQMLMGRFMLQAAESMPLHLAANVVYVLVCYKQARLLTNNNAELLLVLRLLKVRADAGCANQAREGWALAGHGPIFEQKPKPSLLERIRELVIKLWIHVCRSSWPVVFLERRLICWPLQSYPDRTRGWGERLSARA